MCTSVSEDLEFAVLSKNKQLSLVLFFFVFFFVVPPFFLGCECCSLAVLLLYVFMLEFQL